VASQLERHAEQLSALGHPVRLQVLRFIVQGGGGGTAAGDIQSHVGLPASTLSHHLRRLVDSGLLTSRPEGTYHYYAPDYSVLRKLTNYLWEDCCKRGGGGSCC
jgi:ArsR family transcriptional regulator